MMEANRVEGIKCPDCNNDIEEQLDRVINDPNNGGLPFDCCECGSSLQISTNGIFIKVNIFRTFDPDDCDGSCGSICDGNCHDLESGYYHI